MLLPVVLAGMIISLLTFTSGEPYSSFFKGLPCHKGRENEGPIWYPAGRA